MYWEISSCWQQLVEYAAGGHKYEPNAEIAFSYFTSNMAH
jgi:hypothetical protein